MSVATSLWTKTFPQVSVLNNPTLKELRSLASFEEKATAFGAPCYFTQQAGSRSAKSTFVYEEGSFKAGRFQQKADSELVKKVLEAVQGQMVKADWMTLDRTVGKNQEMQFHARLWIPKKYARIALLWSQTLFPVPASLRDTQREPDFLTLYFPDWREHIPASLRQGFPEKIILVNPEAGINYVLGVDYVGETKMSFLRLSMYGAKKKGGLGLHAGSKIIKVRGEGSGVRGQKDSGLCEVGFLLFGLSGTGKTTLTLEDHGLRDPEGVVVLQDDIVLLTPQGKAYGTEDNFYVKTEGLTQKDQPGLFKALMDPGTVFENVYFDEKTKQVDFTNYKYGTNGRALALRSKIPNSDHRVDLEKTHKLIFITRRDTIVPPVTKLNTTQAVAYFMLGESIETSAGDPTRAGQPKHEVGFNPFILGLEDEEGNRLLSILKNNPGIEVYLLNTGSVGKQADQKGFDPNGKKITKNVSAKILEAVARRNIRWAKDPDWRYEVAQEVPGIDDFKQYDPHIYYRPETYARLREEMKEERRKYLAQFDRLEPKILQSL
ncbi:MAG: phosphoenolpyruvate carboxykinase [Elusimicrobia bacterium]|nr:phosphoenolpyruvate carboxykinase [Elusimicrobiota bacterium]